MVYTTYASHDSYFDDTENLPSQLCSYVYIHKALNVSSA